ncbi:Panacea domain-containing protein [Orientia tsutsugamushi]|uniref:Panacea domain-containing protein n=1 Tax=Orientia tsutsugamushi TaxID=784 RepID=UPI0035276BD7
MSCFDVASYFLVLVDREAGDVITQLKLQKLVYFIQGVHLALEEDIEAWENGPVVRHLRSIFGGFEANAIPAPGEIDFSIYTRQQKEGIYKIYSSYGEHTASYLRNLTHLHSIWQQAIIRPSRVITKEEMRIFFKNHIKNIEDYLLPVSKKDTAEIVNAEDQWWMNYDTSVPWD